MLSVFRVSLLLALLSTAASLTRPKNVVAKGSGFVTVPLTLVNKTDVYTQKRQAGTPLYNPDDGTDYIAHSERISPISRGLLLLN
jgi:hypothetical protein